jgi:hypothetical protein
MEQLLHTRSVTLSYTLDTSTHKNYGSALNSYLTFIHLHQLPIDPTDDTLSLFVTYMCHHINPCSVGTYLSDICQELEHFFPCIQEACRSHILRDMLHGCMQMRGTPTRRKQALTIDNLNQACTYYSHSGDHDNYLFSAMLTVGFFTLLCLGELTFPNDVSLCDP